MPVAARAHAGDTAGCDDLMAQTCKAEYAEWRTVPMSDKTARMLCGSTDGRSLIVNRRQGTDGRRSARLDTKLLENMLEVLLNGTGADRQNRGDLAVGFAGCDKGQNLTLALGYGQLRQMDRMHADTVASSPAR